MPGFSKVAEAFGGLAIGFCGLARGAGKTTLDFDNVEKVRFKVAGDACNFDLETGLFQKQIDHYAGLPEKR